MNGDRKTLQKLVLLAVVTLLSVTLAACGGSSDKDEKSDSGDGKLLGMVRNPPLKVGDVELLDVTGDTPKPFTMKAPKGELYLVYFGYTFCPDVCPTTMSDISVALEEIGPDLAKRVTVAMNTVDPDRDTPEVLRTYLGHFFASPISLTAKDQAALDVAAEKFGVQYEVADHEPGDKEYAVEHSGITFVVDETGTVVDEWVFGFDSENMAKDLRTLLEN